MHAPALHCVRVHSGPAAGTLLYCGYQAVVTCLVWLASLPGAVESSHRMDRVLFAFLLPFLKRSPSAVITARSLLSSTPAGAPAPTLSQDHQAQPNHVSITARLLVTSSEMRENGGPFREEFLSYLRTALEPYTLPRTTEPLQTQKPCIAPEEPHWPCGARSKTYAQQSRCQ